VVFLGGGVPIIDAGGLIGAVGVGGAAQEVDHACAVACVDAYLAATTTGRRIA
jgi:uncharacterized protein GlcG (DUF336 family)